MHLYIHVIVRVCVSQDANGDTVTHYAISKRKDEALEALLSLENVDLNAVDSQDKDILLHACLKDHTRWVSDESRCRLLGVGVIFEVLEVLNIAHKQLFHVSDDNYIIDDLIRCTNII